MEYGFLGWILKTQSSLMLFSRDSLSIMTGKLEI